MTQQRLNHCMAFHIHQDKTDAPNLNSIAKEFAQANVSSDIFIFLDHFKMYLHAIIKFQ